MSITTTTVLPPAVQLAFSEKLLAVPTPYFIHNIAADLKHMPANSGGTLRMRRYNPLPSATVPLGNSGLPPPPTPLVAVDIDALIQFYGQWIGLQEQVTLQNEDPVLNSAAERLGVALRQTEDELTRDMLQSTAAVIACSNGVNGDSPTELTRDDIDDVVRALMDANAYTIMEHIEGEDRFGTGPVRDAFIAMANTNLIGDLEKVDGFIAKANYPAQFQTLRPEWGTVGNTRWLLSSIGSVSANASALGDDVYNCFVTGMEAYCVVDQDAYSSQFIYRPPIFSDPLSQTATVGWKMARAQTITNDAWVINLQTTRR